MKKNIKDYTIEELKDKMKTRKIPAFRGGQVFEWIYRDVGSFEEMSNLPFQLRIELDKEYSFERASILRKQVSNIDGTVKYLLAFGDGNAVECVKMEYAHGITVCISTQVGCRMGCRFCASTIGGLIRNLSAGEMVEEIMAVNRDLQEGKKISNVVLMGCGEPFDNYENVMQMIRIVNERKGLNIGARHITISTCGIVPMIERFMMDGGQVNLAISLHASDNTVRSTMMPINHTYPIEDLILACKAYTEKTKRRITFEYSLVHGVNDSEKDAASLAILLRGMLCHVNLIPVNDVAERNYHKPDKSRVYAFQSYLKDHGIEATVRRELGSDIDAACGQLRKKEFDLHEH